MLDPFGARQQKDGNAMSMIRPCIWVKTDGNRELALGETCTFGRHPNNTLCLNHRTVSRWHGLFVQMPNGGFRVVDLGTKNGILVNGRRIDESVKLSEGDSIFVGNQVLMFQGGETLNMESISDLYSTMPLDDSMPSGPQTDIGIDGQGIVVIDAQGSISSSSETARQWFQYYFPDYQPAEDKLPKPVLKWLQDPGKQPSSLPVRFSRGERRLTIRRQSDPNRPGMFLVLTDEQPLFSGERLRDDFIKSFNLTEKESEVIYYVALGKTNSEIAIILGNSERTIHKHLQNAYPKLGVENRSALIVFVYEYYKGRRIPSA